MEWRRFATYLSNDPRSFSMLNVMPILPQKPLTGALKAGGTLGYKKFAIFDQ